MQLSSEFAAILLASALASSGDGWFAENGGFLDWRRATEIKAFWPVPASQIPDAVAMLENESFVAVSASEALRLVGEGFSPTEGKLFLLRAIDVRDRPIPLRVHQAGKHVSISAGTFETCFIFKPTLRQQPVIVPLTERPERLYLSYSCDGP